MNKEIDNLEQYENLSNDDLLKMLNEEIEKSNAYRNFFNEVTDIIIEESELHERISKISERALSTQYRLGKQDSD